MLATTKIEVAVNNLCLPIQTLKIDKDAKHADFKAINPIKFYKRNKVVVTTIHGEASSVDP